MPRRMLVVRWLSAARVMSGALECDHSERKWCSTNHTEVIPISSAKQTCSTISWNLRVSLRSSQGLGTWIW